MEESVKFLFGIVGYSVADKLPPVFYVNVFYVNVFNLNVDYPVGDRR